MHKVFLNYYFVLQLRNSLTNIIWIPVPKSGLSVPHCHPVVQEDGGEEGSKREADLFLTHGSIPNTLKCRSFFVLFCFLSSCARFTMTFRQNTLQSCKTIYISVYKSKHEKRQKPNQALRRQGEPQQRNIIFQYAEHTLLTTFPIHEFRYKPLIPAVHIAAQFTRFPGCHQGTDQSEGTQFNSRMVS